MYLAFSQLQEDIVIVHREKYIIMCKNNEHYMFGEYVF